MSNPKLGPESIQTPLPAELVSAVSEDEGGVPADLIASADDDESAHNRRLFETIVAPRHKVLARLLAEAAARAGKL